MSVTLVSTSALLTACDDDDDTPPGDAGACAVGNASGSTTSPHSHAVGVSAAQISDGATISVTSTLGSGHTHEVPLTSADLATLASECAVTVTTTDGHTHVWTITIA